MISKLSNLTVSKAPCETTLRCNIPQDLINYGTGVGYNERQSCFHLSRSFRYGEDSLLVARWQAYCLGELWLYGAGMDAMPGERALTYCGHTNYVWAVAWTPDGKRIASYSWDATSDDHWSCLLALDENFSL